VIIPRLERVALFLHFRSIALSESLIDCKPSLEFQHYPSSQRSRVAVGIDRSTGLRSLNAIPTALWTNVMLKAERFATPAANVLGIGVLLLFPIDEYSHVPPRYSNTTAINGICFVEKRVAPMRLNNWISPARRPVQATSRRHTECKPRPSAAVALGV